MAPADGATMEMSALGRIRMSRADEKRLARSLSPAVAWPTLALAVALPGAFAAVAILGFTGGLPLWACAILLSFISYGHYTLVHEAIHGNVVAEPRKLAWINTLVGWIGAVGLGIGWPLLQRTHVLHHSHTNTDKDPDIVVKRSFPGLFVMWARDMIPGLLPLALMRRLVPQVDRQLREILSESEVWQCSALSLFTLALLALSVATGHILDWLCLWFIPQQFAVLILIVFFQWLPHHPFDRFDRYGNTRISLWAAGTWLTLQQNLHLMHHLWPSVPFYNYRRLFQALRPVLEAEGARIEGLRPHSSAPGDRSAAVADTGNV